MSKTLAFIKHLFIPHKGNDHKPHILRDFSFATILIVVIAIEAITLNGIAGKFEINNESAVLSSYLVSLTNYERLSADLKPLKFNALLTNAAQMKANDMAAKGYFMHVTPEGKNFTYFLQKAGYDYKYAGENLAVNFFDSSAVEKAWMNSPAHRANILKDRYTEIGIATANGMLDGKPTIFVAQYFGTPAETPVAATSVKTIVTKPDAKTVTARSSNSLVLGVEAEKPSGIIDLVKSNPLNSSNDALLGILVLVSIPFLLALFASIRSLRKKILFNGTILVIAIIGLFLINQILLSPKIPNSIESGNFSESTK